MSTECARCTELSAELAKERREARKQVEVQIEVRENLLRQRDESLAEVRECNRINVESMAEIQRLEADRDEWRRRALDRGYR